MRGDAERSMRAVTFGRDVPVGGFRCTLDTGSWSLSDNLRTILGLDGIETLTTRSFAELALPADQTTMDRMLAAVEDARSFQHFLRLVTRTGKTLSMLALGQVVEGDAGQGRVLVGYLIDLTPAARRSHADQAFAAVIEGFDDPVDSETQGGMLVEQAVGMISVILDTGTTEARELLDDAAERIQSTPVVVAAEVLAHYQRANGITRSRPHLHAEMDDVLGRAPSTALADDDSRAAVSDDPHDAQT